MKATMKKIIWSLGFVILALAAMVHGVYAAHDDIPRVRVEELKKMVDAGADIIVLDAQQRSIYDKGRIKGALSLPWAAEIKDADVEKLPKDKLIVTYCDCGPGENDSADLAAQLMGLGFSNVKVLADPSIRGWKQAGYPMEAK
jgi:rhodanese-related sulfurtransferase